VTTPHHHLLEGSPRLHYLEWTPDAARTIVLLHGNSANAWWWEPVARAIAPEYRLLALDQRGHGDSEWARPAMYSPADYANDIGRLVQHLAPNRERPIVVGHSMGGLNVLAFARNHPESVRGAIAIDVAVTSSRGRDRYLRRLKGLPVVTYPDLATAKARFRLMPNEGGIPDEVIHEIAEKSLARTDEGRWTLKFDRESFLGGDGLDVLDTVREIRIPTMLVRAEHSRIMTAEAAENARASNPQARLVTIADAHHHVILEKPAEVARVIEEFAATLRN
jgi:pimeloyl-ACP methyl ester carboxylesterase